MIFTLLIFEKLITLTIFQADNTLPGFVYDTMRGILRKAEMSDKVDMCETLLRLGGTQDSDGM